LLLALGVAMVLVALALLGSRDEPTRPDVTASSPAPTASGPRAAVSDPRAALPDPPAEGAAGCRGAVASRDVPAGHYLLVDSARLASLPACGAAYRRMKHAADDAVARVDVTAPESAASPWLPNYEGMGAETLAAALVYARSGGSEYRDFVVRANRFVIGSEDSASTNGTGAQDRLLAAMRQIGAYVMAADLVGMDPDVTGSRSGYGSKTWRAWLSALRTKSVGSGNCTSIVDCNLKATNWGAWASASRVAIDVYLDDRADLAEAVGRLKLYLGESTSGRPWIKSGSYDASWACDAARGGVDFVPINPSSCGQDKDGVIVEDASRSDASFPRWDRTGIDYSFHAYGAQLVAALLLDRQGYDVWNWGDRALKRVMDRFDRLGVATGNGRATATHVSWIARHFYGHAYPTVAAQPGDTLGYTDWLYGTGGLVLGKLTRDRRTGAATIVAVVPGPGRLVLSGKGIRKSAQQVPRGGSVNVQVRPTRSTLRRLRRSGHATVRAKLRFLASAGGEHRTAKTIKLLKRR
jgi:hypothetical protein